MKTTQYEYSNHGIKQTIQRITMPEVPGVDLDRIHSETSPRTITIRSAEDWTKHDRLLSRISKGQDMVKHPTRWALGAASQLWGQE